MTRQISRRALLGLSSMILLGLTAGCRHMHKNDCEKCEPNPCPPMCEECDRSWHLFGHHRDKHCDQPCDHCEHAKGKSCCKADCAPCGQSACKSCGKANCKSCAKPAYSVCGKPGCTTCAPQCSPAAPQQPATGVPAQLPITKSTPTPSVTPDQVPTSNERFKAVKPAETSTVIIPKAPVLPSRPQPVVIEQEPAKPAVPVAAKPQEIVVPRRSFADITAKPQFHRNSDYTQLVGELQYYAKNGEWRLRYASIDEEDRYGGSVTLVDGSHMMNGIKEGTIVKVDGILVDSDSREPSPKYRVRTIETIKGE